VQREDKQLLIYLTLAFAIALPILVLSHEIAHYEISKLLGFSPTLHYNYTNFGFPHSIKGDNLSTLDAPITDQVLALASGPVFTDLIGILGICFLFLFRKSTRRSEKLNFAAWAFVILSVFWLRHLVNVILWICKTQSSQNISLNGDEMKLTQLLHWPWWSIIVSSALIAAFLFSMVVRIFIPPNQRQIFIYSLLLGGFTGYFLWYQWLGPVVFP
jgi:hypothetical protein